MVAGLVFLLVFGRGLYKDSAYRNAERKRREAEYEKGYIKDPDVEAQMRRDIGMPHSDQTERRHGP